MPIPSVFLSTAPTDEAINLSWEEMVPWDNFEYTIFRRSPQGVFDSVGTSYLISLKKFVQFLLMIYHLVHQC